jgi:hypothetical protein
VRVLFHATETDRPHLFAITALDESLQGYLLHVDLAVEAIRAGVLPVPRHGRSRLESGLGVTRADWRGYGSVTRNEGVPGSSPGVGSSRFAGIFRSGVEP